MNRSSGRTAIALLGIASAAIVVSPREGCAQSRVDDQGRSLAALGAVIAEARRSPFHRADPTDSGRAARTARVTTMPPPAGGLRVVLEEKGRRAAADDVPNRKVFLATAAAAHLSDIAGVYLFMNAAFSPGGGRAKDLRELSGVAVAALGPALAAAVLGRPFGTALVGSLLGIALGLIPVIAIGESGPPPAVVYSMFALVHAGTTTLATAKW